MARKKLYTLVSLNSGSIDHETFDDGDKLKAALAKIDDKDASEYVLFASQPVPFTISRQPTVIIGALERKPRAKKGEGTRAPRKPKPTTVASDFFDKVPNGAAAAPTTMTAPTAQE